MTPAETAKFEHILALIDEAVGGPDTETVAEHDARIRVLARDSERRRIHRAE